MNLKWTIEVDVSERSEAKHPDSAHSGIWRSWLMVGVLTARLEPAFVHRWGADFANSLNGESIKWAPGKNARDQAKSRQFSEVINEKNRGGPIETGRTYLATQPMTSCHRLPPSFHS
jgi:hypothetical protein